MVAAEKIDPGGSHASLESEAKERATEVVLAYRRVDWDAVEAGDVAAVQVLLSSCELHETTRHFLDDQVGDLGGQLNAGLEKFYGDSVGPQLRRPAILRQLDLGRGTAAKAGQAPGKAADDGLSPRARPQVTVGHTVRMNTGCGHLYVTVNETEDGTPFELFNHMGKAGGCAASQNEAIGRLISYALRCGARIEPLIKQLKGISCHRPAWGEDGKISSCSDAISKALEKYCTAREERVQGAENLKAQLKAAEAREAGITAPEVADDGSAEQGNGRREILGERASFDSLSESRQWIERIEGEKASSSEIHRVQGACVDCGGQLSFEEGCVKCHGCGFTECG
ncbi:MAG: hypothetical protein ACI9EF_003952 [Pseudohongiellaceae bacterium]|jgi:hypothetical protein